MSYARRFSTGFDGSARHDRPANIPPIANDELLPRFITQAKQFRPSDQSVKPDFFIPFRVTQLSVMRHTGEARTPAMAIR